MTGVPATEEFSVNKDLCEDEGCKGGRPISFEGVVASCRCVFSDGDLVSTGWTGVSLLSFRGSLGHESVRATAMGAGGDTFRLKGEVRFKVEGGVGLWRPFLIHTWFKESLALILCLKQMNNCR